MSPPPPGCFHLLQVAWFWDTCTTDVLSQVNVMNAIYNIVKYRPTHHGEDKRIADAMSELKASLPVSEHTPSHMHLCAVYTLTS